MQSRGDTEFESTGIWLYVLSLERTIKSNAWISVRYRTGICQRTCCYLLKITNVIGHVIERFICDWLRLEKSLRRTRIQIDIAAICRIESTANLQHFFMSRCCRIAASSAICCRLAVRAIDLPLTRVYGKLHRPKWSLTSTRFSSWRILSQRLALPWRFTVRDRLLAA